MCLLSIGFLQQSPPELWRRTKHRAVDQVVIDDREVVIHHHLQPLTKPPHLQLEGPCTMSEIHVP